MRESGVPPSFDEMKDALELKSKSGIHRLITALVERGFIRRLPHRARAIEVIKLPEDMAGARTGVGLAPAAGTSSQTDGHPGAGHAAGLGLREAGSTFVPEMIEGGLGRNSASGAPKPAGAGSPPDFQPAAHVMAGMNESASVPMMGRIAAGVPISAIQDHNNDVVCPPDMLAGGEHFALEVHGDSMIEAGIHDGDTVIIKRCNSANNGDIVVALVEKEEATLKRLRKKGSTVALEAANPAYETRIFGPDQVDVQGRLVGLIRKY